MDNEGTEDTVEAVVEEEAEGEVVAEDVVGDEDETTATTTDRRSKRRRDARAQQQVNKIWREGYCGVETRNGRRGNVLWNFHGTKLPTNPYFFLLDVWMLSLSMGKDEAFGTADITF